MTERATYSLIPPRARLRSSASSHPWLWRLSRTHRVLHRDGITTDSVEVGELEPIAAARERVAEVARSFEDMGFAATADIDIGHPAPAILMLAEKGDYDLVVMGSRGLGAVRAKLLGSVGNEMCRHAAATLVAR